MVKRIGIILFFMMAVGARHAVPLQGLAFADSYTQDGKPCPPECVSDSMEIETYYPSPYGYYEELRGDKIIVGDSDNSYINETDLPPRGTITFEPLADDPDSSDGRLYEGSLYYQGAIGGTKGKFRFYDGSAWQDLGGSEFWKASTTVSSNIYTDKSVKFGSYSTVGRPTCNADTLGAVIFDTNKNNLYLCKLGAWEPVGGYSYIQSFTVPGTYTFVVPNGITEIMIEAWSAGGGGGGGNGVHGTGSAGSGGGSSSVGSLIFASGGNGGSGGCCGGGGGNGGTSSASINISGQNGTSGGGGGAGGFGAGNGGGGGGAGPYSSGSGGGGGGGAYGKGIFNVVSGVVYTVIVGAGGSGGGGGSECCPIGSYCYGSCTPGGAGGTGGTGGNGKAIIYY